AVLAQRVVDALRQVLVVRVVPIGAYLDAAGLVGLPHAGAGVESVGAREGTARPRHGVPPIARSCPDRLRRAARCPRPSRRRFASTGAQARAAPPSISARAGAAL